MVSFSILSVTNVRDLSECRLFLFISFFFLIVSFPVMWQVCTNDYNFINTFQPDDANRQTHILHKIMFSLSRKCFKYSLWSAPRNCSLRQEKHVFCCNQRGLLIHKEPWWILAHTPSTSRKFSRQLLAGATRWTSACWLWRATEIPRSNFSANAKAANENWRD